MAGVKTVVQFDDIEIKQILTERAREIVGDKATSGAKVSIRQEGDLTTATIEYIKSK